jgi:hypothetical protein
MGAKTERKGTLMYCLTICFGPAATTWALMFKTKETAEIGWNAIALAKANNVVVNFSDDFGQEIVLESAPVHGVMLEDLSLSKLAHIERALHQARMQAEGQKMAQTDPALVHAARGPNIISPMMGGNGRFPT